MSSPIKATNFFKSNGQELKFLDREYFLNVYRSYAEVLPNTPIRTELWGWGDATELKLGITSNVDRTTPIPIASNIKYDGIKAVHRGVKLGAVITGKGELWLWGSAGVMTGTGSYSSKTPVTTFAGGTDWAAITSTSSFYNYHVAAIKQDGSLWTWGTNAKGALGTGDRVSRTTPVTTFAGGNDWKQVVCTDTGMLAIKTNGSLWAWGQDVYFTNLLGIAQSHVSTPATLYVGSSGWAYKAQGDSVLNYDYKTIAGESNPGFSQDSYAAIKTDGTLWLWGNRSTIFLGNNQPNGLADNIGQSSGSMSSTPVTTFAGGTNWKQVSMSDYSVMATKTDGTLWGWGRSEILGINSLSSSLDIPTPVTTFAGGTDWKMVAASRYGGYGIKTDGSLWVWGNNSSFFGINNSTGQLIMTPVTTFAGGNDWKSVSTKTRTSAAIKTDGSLWVWGLNNIGMLGIGESSYLTVYTPVTTFAGGNDWRSVSVGEYNMVATKTDGTLWVWGDWRNCGANVNTLVSTPITTFAGGTDWASIASGHSATYATKTDGTLWLWGNRQYSILGTGEASNAYAVASTPITTFTGGTGWKDVFGSYLGSMAVKDDGTLFIWGYSRNYSGIFPTENLPLQVYEPSDEIKWTVLDSYGGYSAGIKSDGTLWTWGDAAGSGTGVLTGIISTPVTTFAGGNNWRTVSLGSFVHGGIKSDGTLWVWGNSFRGGLANGSYSGSNISTPITTFAGGNNWKFFSAGVQSAKAIKSDGTLWTWGWNYDGNMGIGSVIETGYPQQVIDDGEPYALWKSVTQEYRSVLATKSSSQEVTGFGAFANLEEYFY